MVLDELQPNDQMEFANCIYGKGQRFVPLIFLKGQMLGGYGELHQLHQ
jgi:glutaredoxin